MIRSSVTLSLVPQAKGGPFVFWDDLPASCARAAALGFDAIEIFLPSPEAVERSVLQGLLTDHGLQLAAVGTGAGWILHRLHLSHADPQIRAQARAFISGIIDYAGSLGAPAIIGSMQGRFENAVTREQALAWLAEGLNELGARAERHGVPLLYEPLNRYETNLINRIGDGVDFLETLQTDNVKLLADLFHMNIEEGALADAIRVGGRHIGHVHFVDSNRWPAGHGHTDFRPIAQALRGIEYSGYLSAEALPLPSPDEAARQTMVMFESLFPEMAGGPGRRPQESR